MVGGGAGTQATYTLSVVNVFGSAETQPITLNFAAPSGAYAEKIAQDHPSSYWRLGEKTGTLATDLAGFNDGTYGGAFTLGEPGAFAVDPDTSVRFGGGNAVIPSTSTLNPSGPFTVEFWAKPDQSGQLSRCVIGSQNRNVGRSGYAIYQGLNGAFWECHIGDASTVQIWLYSRTNPQAGQWYHVAVVYSGAGTARIYVNGADDTSTDSDVEGGYLPASGTAFEIASRFGGGVPYPGTVDDVAFYNYALSDEQLLNHYKIQWVKSEVTQQPTGVTSVEGTSITLSAVVSGLPNTYQWFKGNVALTADPVNADGTAHYPQGVTGTTLVISQPTPADNGAYHLVVTNPLGNSTTVDVQVVVNKDTAPPTIESVTALPTPNPTGGKPYLVKVLFNKRMDTATAQNSGNYTISGGVTVNSVTFHESVTGLPLGADWRMAVLTTSGLTPGQKYTLTVQGVKDRTLTGNPLATTSVSFQAPVLTPGIATWDYYFLGQDTVPSPLDVAWLTASAQYPNGPMTNCSPTTFNSGAITGDDLANVAPFGSLGSYYGSSLSAWVTPTVSGNYTFFLTSDDSSELYLSSNDDPTTSTLIAYQACCPAFTEPPADNTSTPQALVAGQKYFLRAVQTEGGGGDYVRVAWRMEGDATPAASLKPIAAEFLSAYAAVPAAKFNAPVLAAGQLTLTWTGSATLQEATDVMGPWSNVSGNPASGYTVAPSAPYRFYRLVQ